MKKKTRKNRQVASRAKLALIGVLVLVLVAVWGSALIGDKPAAAVAARPDPPRTPRIAVQAETAPAPPQDPPASASQTPVVDWPSVPLEQAVLNDPFAKPAWAIPPTATVVTSAEGPNRRDPEALRSLQEQRATMIILTGESKVAAIGDREVRVGDFLNGYQVVDITRDGIVVVDQP